MSKPAILLARATASSTAPAQLFYDRWIDVTTHPEWSHEMAWLRLDEPLRVGARGTLKPKSGPKSGFVVSELVPGRVYADTTLLPGARLTFRHAANDTADGSDLSVDVSISGRLASIWRRVLGAGIESETPHGLRRLVSMVESAR